MLRIDHIYAQKEIPVSDDLVIPTGALILCLLVNGDMVMMETVAFSKSKQKLEKLSMFKLEPSNLTNMQKSSGKEPVKENRTISRNELMALVLTQPAKKILFKGYQVPTYSELYGLLKNLPGEEFYLACPEENRTVVSLPDGTDFLVLEF